MPIIPIDDYLPEERVVDLSSSTKVGAIEELCAILGASEAVGDAAALRTAVLAREDVMSTGIGLGIAVPHAKIDSVKEFALALGRSRTGIEFNALDGRPVHIVVLIAGPDDRQARYLQILASVTLRLKREEVRRALLEAAGPAEMAAVLRLDA